MTDTNYEAERTKGTPRAFPELVSDALRDFVVAHGRYPSEPEIKEFADSVGITSPELRARLVGETRVKATAETIQRDWWSFGEAFTDSDGYRIDPREIKRTLPLDPS